MKIDFTVLKMIFKGLLNERMPSNYQISIQEKTRELRTATETDKLTLTSEPNYGSHFIKYQEHYIMKFQNRYKKLKNIVLSFLNWKGIRLTTQHFHYQIGKKKRWPRGWCMERKTYSYSHVQASFWLYQLRLLSGTIARGGTDFFYVRDVIVSFQYF